MSQDNNDDLMLINQLLKTGSDIFKTSATIDYNQQKIEATNNMANANYCAVAHAHAGGGINDTNVVQMPASGRAVGSVGCHVMSALNDATAFDTALRRL